MGWIPKGDVQLGAHHFPIVSLDKNQKQTLAMRIFGSKSEWFPMIVLIARLCWLGLLWSIVPRGLAEYVDGSHYLRAKQLSG